MALLLLPVGAPGFDQAAPQRAVERSDSIDAERRDELTGIGAMIEPPLVKNGKQMFDAGARVTRLLPHGPAFLSGELNEGDMIIAIAEGDGPGVDVPGREFSDVINRIRGATGTEVRLTVVPARNPFVKVKVISIFREPLVGGGLVGKQVQNERLTIVADETTQTLSDLRGKIVVLEFWTTTCAPCIEGIDEIQSLPQEFPEWSDKVALVTVNIDDELSAAKAMIEERNWTVTHNVWRDAKFVETFGAELLPMVVIVDASGRIAAAGNPRSTNIRKNVNRLLGM